MRLLTGDDPEQFEAAVGLVRASSAEAPLFVNPLVIWETVWVVERIYKIDRTLARSKVAGLLDTVEMKVPDVLNMNNWTAWLNASHPDFSDVVIAELNQANGCVKTLTFDRRAAASVPGMELLT